MTRTKSSRPQVAEGRRHAVFLQGMPSPFFRRIADHLLEQGWHVTRINLCAGDLLVWRGANSVSYRGSLADWPAFIDRLFVREGVTDLVLLGEQRRYHRDAVDIATSRRIRVTVTDFGYIRPDWITWERNGMGGNSLFPRDPAAIRRLAASAADVDWTPKYVDSALRMARADLVHNFANVFLGWLYPRYRRSDMRPPTLVYTPASAWRLLTNRMVRDRMDAAVREFAASKLMYFVFPLQLDFDFQIVAYSPFSGVEQAIDLVLDSFARHAPAQAHLVLKEHPWDPALQKWEKIMKTRAAALGIGDRVHYLRGGHLDTLVKASAGVVTVNSTTGLRALQLGRPLQVLGQAVYDVAGLTHQRGLHTFWTEGQQPDPALVRDFLKALAGTIQIRGVFFQEPGLGAAVREAADRLLADAVGEPLTRKVDGPPPGQPRNSLS